MILPSSRTELSREALAFLQRRVSLFGLVGGGLGLVFLVFRLVVTVSTGLYGQLLEPHFGYHALAVAFSLGIWLACRTGTRSLRFVQIADGVGFVGTSVAYTLMGWHIPLAGHPDFIVLLALTYGLVARSVYVPSSARRTLVLSLVVGAPLVAGTYAAYLGVDDAMLKAAPPTSRSRMPDSSPSDRL